jgi:hypothetical protein
VRCSDCTLHSQIATGPFWPRWPVLRLLIPVTSPTSNGSPRTPGRGSHRECHAARSHAGPRNPRAAVCQAAPCASHRGQCLRVGPPGCRLGPPWSGTDRPAPQNTNIADPRRSPAAIATDGGGRSSDSLPGSRIFSGSLSATSVTPRTFLRCYTSPAASFSCEVYEMASSSRRHLRPQHAAGTEAGLHEARYLDLRFLEQGFQSDSGGARDCA